jgi:hypothetical protein
LILIPKPIIIEPIMTGLTVPGNSILTMPLPDTKSAPERFKGRYTRIKPFLTHYELLLEQNNVISDKDKCELVTRYCSRKVTEFIQALPSHTEKRWTKLKEDLLKYYDADLDNKKYRIKDLVKLVRACREKRLKNLSAWREYGRKFITIGGWLLKKNKISDDEYATYYWNGIPKVLRVKVENRLLARDPVRSLTTPFKVDEINASVEALLQRDRFDMNFAGSDEDDESEDEGDGGDETSDSEDEDELKTMRRRIRKHARYTKKRGSASDSEDSDDEYPRIMKQQATREIKRKLNGKDEPEIESLIKQLNSMAVDDPGYAALVFRALKIDPEVINVIRPPVFMTRPSVPSTPQFPRTTQGPSIFQPRTPPHMSNGFAPRSFGRNMPDEDKDRCFGCGARGHRMNQCPGMQELLMKRIVVKNAMGRYVYGDGRPIQRLPGETLVSAVKHETHEGQEKPVGSHLIKIVEPFQESRTRNVFCEAPDPETSDSEGDSCEENIISAAVMERFDNEELFGFTYPVTRTE